MLSIRQSQWSFRQKLADYLVLCKYKVVFLLVITAWAGLALAPVQQPIIDQLASLLGIGFLSASAAVINHLVDANLDTKMARTRMRPLAKARIDKTEAILLALLLAISGVLLLEVFANRLTTLLTLLALVVYAVFYSMYLKWATPQNIVIGGIAGAMPPLLGWVSQTGKADAEAWLLVLIIFIWTPPHFWALAIHRRKEYAEAKVPMLPVTHGVTYCKISILLYSVLLFIACLLPYLIKMSGSIYLAAAVAANTVFIYKAVTLLYRPKDGTAYQLFKYSILFLAAIFISLYVDKAILAL